VFRFIRATKICSIMLAASIMLLAAPSLADADTGTVHLTFAKAAIFVGVGRAKGTLRFHHRDYPLRISGVSAGSIGLGVTKLRGHAHNLRYAADIAGNYLAVSTGIAVVGGAKVARLLNSNGVVYLQLDGPQAGLELGASVSGMTISLR